MIRFLSGKTLYLECMGCYCKLSATCIPVQHTQPGNNMDETRAVQTLGHGLHRFTNFIFKKVWLGSCFAALTVLFTMIAYFQAWSSNFTLLQPHYRYTQYTDEFLLKTEGCVIPQLQAFAPDLLKFIKIQKHLNCNKEILITYKINYTIVINKTIIDNYFSNFFYCDYIPYEKTIGNDRKINILHKRTKRFTRKIAVLDAFATVKCFDRLKQKIGEQQYAFIIRNRKLDKILDDRYNIQGGKRPMNIHFLVFESTSRLNFIRHMNMTRRFILDKLAAVEMVGFNKLGLNTFPNLYTIYTGRHWKKANVTDGYLDNNPFIWKNLTKMGYRTFSIEDHTDIATFHYLRSGFYRAPMLHYMYPYSRMLERPDKHTLCSENKLQAEVLLDRLIEFVEVYHDVPHFTHSIFSKYTHDNPNGLGLLDMPYLNMLKTLWTKGYFENSILILIGDHGSRYGKIRQTYQGRLEESLPPLYVILPEWFRKTYRHLHENLISNSKKLVSNFDIYATFRDIMNIGKGHEKYQFDGKYGVSLLRPISETRTCEDLRIPPLYCSCSQRMKINTTDENVKQVSTFLLRELNRQLANVTSLCSKLKLDNVISSEISLPFQHFNETEISDYLLKVKVLPSNGLFEADVRYDSRMNASKLLGNIVRLDKYGEQSSCIKSEKNARVLERFCYCKKLL